MLLGGHLGGNVEYYLDVPPLREQLVAPLPMLGHFPKCAVDLFFVILLITFASALLRGCAEIACGREIQV